MDVKETLRQAVEMSASDIFIIAGLPLTYKVDGRQKRMETRLMPADTAAVISDIYTLCGRSRSRIEREDMDDDFSFSIPELGRFRANILHQRGSLAAVIRVIRFGLPEPEMLNIPPEVLASARLMKGLVLVTGSAGSGKSTTLACLIHAINQTREGHIITMEDPIEYIHRHDRCIVTQREISTDSPSYVSALRSALRESPDVILLGEMRDYETIEVAMTAEQTGQLLFSIASQIALVALASRPGAAAAASSTSVNARITRSVPSTVRSRLAVTCSKSVRASGFIDGSAKALFTSTSARP